MHYRYVSFRRLHIWPMSVSLSGYPSVRSQSVLHACTEKHISDPKLAKPRDPSKSSRFSNQVIVYQWTSWCPRHQVSAQMAGFLTRKRYMVFVDYLILVHLMQSQSAEEAVIAKQSFEDCRSHGVEVKHYHADNGILHPWKDNCRERHQGVSYAGVNPIIKMDDERRIRSIQEQARCSLIHAHHRWPSAITANSGPRGPVCK
jgi:hypothetical protein